MGESHFSAWPVVLYAINLLACAIGYTIMSIVTVNVHGPDSEIAMAIGKDKKGKISLLIYICAVPVAYFAPLVACGLFVIVSLIWFVPDKRIERVLG